jgi:AcrR family transcriptional regulator
MASVVTRESYFDAGLEVLSDLGYGGLKLAEVCNRLGVTTGSFYHYFASWSAYTRALVGHWMQARTVSALEAIRAEPDPRRRIDALIQEGLALPHGAEGDPAAAWSSPAEGSARSRCPGTGSSVAAVRARPRTGERRRPLPSAG